MKKPKTPSSSWFQSLTENPKLRPWIVEGAPLPRHQDYLHWDKLRHLKPPEPLTSEEWWTILKFRRTAQQTPIPLQDESNSPFTFFITEKTFQQLHEIDLKAGGSIEALDEVTNPDTRDRYYISSIMEESITSSLLEGAATTRSDAKAFLRSGKQAATHAQRMIINNYRTMQNLVEWKKEPLTVDRLLEIHQTITAGTLTLPEQEGRFRLSTEKIDIGSEVYDETYHIPPSAEQLPDRVQAMCDFANDDNTAGFLHPVIRSIILHFWLAWDHPFVDGNGRTARALFYWSMLRHGYWLFEFLSISRILNNAPTQYYRAFLYTETDDNDLNYFILHQLDVLQRAISDLHAYLESKRRETSSSKALGPQSSLNHRQIAILQKALRKPGFAFSFKSHQTSHNIVYGTARTDLLELAQKGYLDQTKIKNRLIFIAPKNLAERLE